MRQKILFLLFLLLAFNNLSAIAQPKRSQVIFTYNTDEFWLNLHHFLYVLARHENKESDATRSAVAGAPVEEERGLSTLSDADKAIWLQSVTDYAAGPAKKDLVFDDSLAAITKSLARAGEAESLRNSGVDPAYASILESAAPIYRKVWWKQHREANQRWQKSIQTLVNKHGPAMLLFITKAFKLDWPATGYPAHVSAYANWAGAYSTVGDLLVLSSLSSEMQGDYGLEIIFHEAMHQWDEQMSNLLRAEARKQGKRVPPGVTHSLIFFTAGEATRRVLPGHVPYAEKFGIWQRGFGRFKAPIDETWKPYLDGRGTREEAIESLIKRVGVAANP